MRQASPEGCTTTPSPTYVGLAQVFEANIDVVFGFVLARCGSRPLAEDIAGDTFADAARAFRDGKGEQVERAWLLHVARLRLIDHWRRDDRHRKRVNRLTSMAMSAQVLPDEDGDPDVLTALDSLSVRQRAVLLLRYVDDYSVSEVAEAMEISYQATESLLARARRALLTSYRAQKEDDGA